MFRTRLSDLNFYRFPLWASTWAYKLGMILEASYSKPG